MLDQQIDAMSVDELTKPERRGTDPASKSGDCPRFYAWQTVHKSSLGAESGVYELFFTFLQIPPCAAREENDILCTCSPRTGQRTMIFEKR